MKAYVYILRDEAGRFYIGSTKNIEQRLKYHEAKITWTTARMKEPKLVLCQEYDSVSLARKIEMRIKKLKRKDYIQRMVDDGFIRLK